MAVSMWGMNESCRRMSLTLLLAALLLHHGVVCQDQEDTTVEALAEATVVTDAATGPVDSTLPTVAPTDLPAPEDPQAVEVADEVADDAATPVPDAATPAPDAATPGPEDATPPAPALPDITAAPSWSAVPPVLVTLPPDEATVAVETVDDDVAGGVDSGPTAGPEAEAGAVAETEAAVVVDDPAVVESTPPPAPEPEADPTPRPLQHSVVCLVEEQKDRAAVRVELQTPSDCEGSKARLEALQAPWCSATPCALELFQEVGSNILLVSSPNAGAERLEQTFNSAVVKAGLGVVKAEPRAEAKGSAVFVSVLVLGLLLAAGLVGGFCLRNRRNHSSKAMRLAEEAYPADEENQGNTLVSVAPLTAPELQEKPALNGDSPPNEDKTPPPPTNGHPATKTADTEL